MISLGDNGIDGEKCPSRASTDERGISQIRKKPNTWSIRTAPKYCSIRCRRFCHHRHPSRIIASQLYVGKHQFWPCELPLSGIEPDCMSRLNNAPSLHASTLSALIPMGISAINVTFLERAYSAASFNCLCKTYCTQQMKSASRCFTNVSTLRRLYTASSFQSVNRAV